MAKEAQNWARYAMLAMTIIGVGFGAGMKINNNANKNTDQDKAISSIEEDVKENRESLHKEELARTKMVGTINEMKGDVKEMKGDFKEFMRYIKTYDFDKKDK